MIILETQKVLLEIIKLSNSGIVIFKDDESLLVNFIDVAFNSCMIQKLNVNPFKGLSNIISFTTDSLDLLKSQKSDIYFDGRNIISGDYMAKPLSDNNSVVLKYIHNFNIDYSLRSLDATIEDIKADNAFVEIIGGRADDGATMYRVQGKNRLYYMSIYSNMLPINKPDKASLDIYDDGNISFITKFTIKKKLFTISVYVRYAHIRR